MKAFGIAHHGKIETRLQVVRISGNGRFERGRLGETGGLVLEFQCILHGGIGVARALVLGDHVERGARLVHFPGRHIDAGKADQGLGMVGHGLENHAVDLGGLAEIAGLAGLGRRAQRLGDLTFETVGGGSPGGGGGNDALGKAAHLALGHGAHEAIDRAAAGKGEDGGNGLDAELAGDLGMLVDVDLDQADLPGLLGDDLFERRAQLPAGAAPGGPEIDQDRNLARCLDDVDHEGGIAGITHEGDGGRGRAGGAIHGHAHIRGLLALVLTAAMLTLAPVSGLFAPLQPRLASPDSHRQIG